MNKILSDPIKHINLLNEVVPKLISAFDSKPEETVDKVKTLFETIDSKIPITFDSNDSVTKFAAARFKVLFIQLFKSVDDFGVF